MSKEKTKKQTVGEIAKDISKLAGIPVPEIHVHTDEKFQAWQEYDGSFHLSLAHAKYKRYLGDRQDVYAHEVAHILLLNANPNILQIMQRRRKSQIDSAESLMNQKPLDPLDLERGTFFPQMENMYGEMTACFFGCELYQKVILDEQNFKILSINLGAAVAALDEFVSSAKDLSAQLGNKTILDTPDIMSFYLLGKCWDNIIQLSREIGGMLALILQQESDFNYSQLFSIDFSYFFDDFIQSLPELMDMSSQQCSASIWNLVSKSQLKVGE